jgi:hypothetical protein
VVNQGGSGILTSVAAPGTEVGRGAQLYAVANHPVRLLLGGTPAYRDFTATMADGPDVGELNENLVALGMDPDHRIVAGDHFGRATAAAIRRWQASWGLPPAQRTGTLPLGQVTFQPVALRVGQVRPTVGSSIGPNTVVLTATSTSQVVTVQLSSDRRSLVHQGDAVTVSLPTGPPLAGRITTIGAPSAQGGSTGDGNNPGGTTAPGQPGQTTVPVTIGLDGPVPGPVGDQTTVQVGITTGSHAGVLMVPVAALLARPGSGYEVRLVPGGAIPVQPGLFDETTGMVEVSGLQLTAGQQVEVPAS